MRKVYDRVRFFLNVSALILFGLILFSCKTVAVKDLDSGKVKTEATPPTQKEVSTKKMSAIETLAPVSDSSPPPEAPAPKADPVSSDAKILEYLSSNNQQTTTKEVSAKSYLKRSSRDRFPDDLKGIKIPRDRFGLIDWVKLQKKKIVNPKWTIDPEMTPDDEMTIDSDILFEAKSKVMKNVVFSHELHSGFLSCETCHETKGGAIFNMEAGSNRVRMADIVKGKWCGRCHGKVAFPLEDCKRCHVRSKKMKVTEDLVTR